jgi:hypothetical protein
VTLDPGDAAERPDGHLRIAPTPTGGAVLAWSGARRHDSPVRVANIFPRGAFEYVSGRRRYASLGISGNVGGLAVGADGRTTVLVRTLGVDEDPTSLVALRSDPHGAPLWSSRAARNRLHRQRRARSRSTNRTANSVLGSAHQRVRRRRTSRIDTNRGDVTVGLSGGRELLREARRRRRPRSTVAVSPRG